MERRERRELRRGPATAAIEIPTETNEDNDDDVEMDVSVDGDSNENTTKSTSTVTEDPATKTNKQTLPKETTAATATVTAAAMPMPHVLLNNGKLAIFFLFTTLLLTANSARRKPSKCDDVLVLRRVLHRPPRRSTKGQDAWLNVESFHDKTTNKLSIWLFTWLWEPLISNREEGCGHANGCSISPGCVHEAFNTIR